MRYGLLDIDVTSSKPVDLPDECEGIGVLLRHGGRPVDFWIEPLPAGRTLNIGYLYDRIFSRSGIQLAQAALATDLPGIEQNESHSSPAPLPSVTIAICTKDRSELLRRTLASIQLHLALPTVQTLLDQGLRVETLVVDNKSVDERTRIASQQFDFVRYVYEPLAGLDFARNRAIRESTANLLIYLDDDAIVDSGWLPGLIDAFLANPDAGGFTGQVLPLEMETDAQILFEQNGGFRRGFKRIRFDPTMQSDPLFPGGAGVFGTGTNMAFRRDVLVDLGGFDEALDTGAPLPGGGDHDIFYRVIRSNRAMVYEPTYLVFHEHRRDMQALKRQFYSWGTGVMAFLTKSIESDPEARRNLKAVIRWWFRNQFKQLYRSVRGRHPLPVSMTVSELHGGVVGLAGEYRRSQKRTAKIRESA